MESAPPPIQLPNDVHFHTDMDSTDVRDTYPDLPSTHFNRRHDRQAFLRGLDAKGYEEIKEAFPGFVPPRG